MKGEITVARKAKNHHSCYLDGVLVGTRISHRLYTHAVVARYSEEYVARCATSPYYAVRPEPFVLSWHQTAQAVTKPRQHCILLTVAALKEGE